MPSDLLSLTTVSALGAVGLVIFVRALVDFLAGFLGSARLQGLQARRPLSCDVCMAFWAILALDTTWWVLFRPAPSAWWLGPVFFGGSYAMAVGGLFLLRSQSLPTFDGGDMGEDDPPSE
jgi:hypothetical protein